MSRDKDQLLGHAADNDGIDEYDNALPDWWLGLFILTVVWGIGYGIEYHFVSNRSQVSRYEAEMKAAAEKWPDRGAAAIAFDAATVDAGAAVFSANCVACHAADLTGGIGPSLVDATWIHGGEPEQIRTTITKGVPDKGMITWGPLLGPEKIAAVTAYIVTKNKEAAASAPQPGAVVDAGGTPDAAGTPETGEQIFVKNCVVCHGEQMEGKVGPNLVDTTWIHGGTLADIEKTITNGVPEKGMVSWGPVLGADKIKAVAEYVHSKGTAPL